MKFSATIQSLETVKKTIEQKIEAVKADKEAHFNDEEKRIEAYAALNTLYDLRHKVDDTIANLIFIQEAEL